MRAKHQKNPLKEKRGLPTGEEKRRWGQKTVKNFHEKERNNILKPKFETQEGKIEKRFFFFLKEKESIINSKENKSY